MSIIEGAISNLSGRMPLIIKRSQADTYSEINI